MMSADTRPSSQLEKPNKSTFVDRLYNNETIASFLKRNSGFNPGDKPPTKNKKKRIKKIFKPIESLTVEEPLPCDQLFDTELSFQP